MIRSLSIYLLIAIIVIAISIVAYLTLSKYLASPTKTTISSPQQSIHIEKTTTPGILTEERSIPWCKAGIYAELKGFLAGKVYLSYRWYVIDCSYPYATINYTSKYFDIVNKVEKTNSRIIDLDLRTIEGFYLSPDGTVRIVLFWPPQVLNNSMGFTIVNTSKYGAKQALLYIFKVNDVEFSYAIDPESLVTLELRARYIYMNETIEVHLQLSSTNIFEPP